MDLLIDTDIGVDDALALILALRSPAANLTGIVAVAGNVDAAQAASNVKTTLAYCEPRETPRLFIGSDKPISGPRYSAESVHGDDGLGDIGDMRGGDGLLKYGKKMDIPAETGGVEAIAAFLRAGHENRLVFIGPLTDLAYALKRPDLDRASTSQIFIMGGSIQGAGNVTRYAEFNFYCDPEAAEVVFQTGRPVHLIPLETCKTYVLTRDFLLRRLETRKNIKNEFVYDIHRKYMDFYRQVEGIDGCYPHDAITVAAALHPEMFEWRRANVRIGIEGETRGQSLVSCSHEGHVNVACGFDRAAFEQLLLMHVLD